MSALILIAAVLAALVAEVFKATAPAVAAHSAAQQEH